MSRNLRLGMCLSLLGGAWGPTLATAGEDNSASEAVVKLLDLGWQTAPQARQKVDSLVSGLPASAKADVRVQQAYLLAVLKQKRYPDAGKRAEAMVARNPQDYLAWHAKIWLAVLSKKYPAALVDIQGLCESLPEPAEQAKQPKEFNAVGKHLGHLVGFLEGPAGSAVKESERDTCLKTILARLNPASSEAFEQARREVQQEYKKLLSEQGLAEVDAEEKAEQKREDLRKDAAAERESADKGREQVAEERRKLQEEYRAQMNSLAGDERPAQIQLLQAQTTALNLQAEITRIAAQIGRAEAILRELDSRKSKDRDRNADLQRDQVRREVDRLRIEGSRFQAQLQECQRLGTLAQTRLNEIAQRRLIAQDAYGKKVGMTELELADLKRRDAKADAAEKTARKTTGDKRRSTAVGTRAAALTTYVPFPLDEEKQKLLRQQAAATPE